MQFPLTISPGPDNCSNPFEIISFKPIVTTPSEIMGYILSVNIYSSENMCSLVDLSTINDDPSESNSTYSEDPTLEDSMWYILSFEIVQKRKGIFLVRPLGVFFLALHIGLLEFGFYLLVLHSFLANSVFGTLIQLILNFSILESLCKNKPPNISIIDYSKKR